jgi:guanylate kinase
MTARVFMVSAPSGAGKSSLVAALLSEEKNIALSVSHTTRTPRTGERHGKEYFFVSQEQFASMREQGDFLECAQVYGNHYGTSRGWVEETLGSGKDIVLEIDWQGARQLRHVFAQAIGIFILPPSLPVLKQRLESRGKDAPDVIARRLAAAQEDVQHVGDFDYVIINKEFSEAVRDLTSIVRAERLRREPQVARHRELIEQLRRQANAED